MSAFYDRLNATAQRLIADKGKAASVIRITNSGPPHAPVQSEQPYPALIVETGQEITIQPRAYSQIPPSLIQAGDVLGIMSTDIAIILGTADKIVIDGQRYNFVDIKPLNPGGTTLLYEFLARK
ncbi:MAG: hypothetical protein ACPHN2_08665 [Sinimarinibacterium flocculans]|uniref:hypothetical protein n=1 Tax=Sinimarinibacterium flocculans TaxID=985250 RepID=UPI003C4F2BF8